MDMFKKNCPRCNHWLPVTIEDVHDAIEHYNIDVMLLNKREIEELTQGIKDLLALLESEKKDELRSK